jgi:lipid-binding SYLF domain-containing protein
MKHCGLFMAIIFGVILAPQTLMAVDIEDYSSTIEIFKQSDQVQPFFKNAYGYAVFPSIGKGGLIIGGAYGRGQVYIGTKVTGLAKLVKFSIGLQAGGQAFSEIIFFEDKRAYDEFTGGEFAFDATASAVAITAGAEAKAGSAGTTVGANVGSDKGARAPAEYYKGMAIFVHSIGGFMAEASIGGQKFSFELLK